jgi:hypothetical protein
MNFINKIFEKFNLSFMWKGNKKKIVKQTGEGLQVHQEQNGITNIFQIQNLTVTKIEEIAGIDISQDQNLLMKSAGQRFLAEQNTRQENLKNAVDKAELNTITNPQEVEKDWFLKWMDISQTVSRENVQEILAKILSGEVKASGTFSIRTLEILKNLSKEELALFQKFCDISYHVPLTGNIFTHVICEPFGNPGDNGLAPLGLSYLNLTILQDAGLIKTDLNSWIEFQIPQILKLPFNIGSSKFVLQTTDVTTESKPHVKVINFTNVGLELRSVLDLGTNPEYNTKFLDWVNDKWKMIPTL